MRNNHKWLSISVHNWTYFIHALIVQALVITLVVGVCMTFVPTVVDMTTDLVVQLDLSTFADDFCKIYNDGDFSTEELASLLAHKIDHLKDVASSAPDVLAKIELSIFWCLLLICAYRVLISLLDVALESNINEFMSTNSLRPLFWYFAKKIGTTLKFSLLQFVFAFPLDIMAVSATFGFALIFAVFWGANSLIPIVIVGVIIFSLRYTMLALWLPSVVVDNVGVYKALANNFALLSRSFWRLFWYHFMLILFMAVAVVVTSVYLLNVTASIVTAILMLLLFYFVKCVNISAYYEINDRPYFATKVNIKQKIV